MGNPLERFFLESLPGLKLEYALFGVLGDEMRIVAVEGAEANPFLLGKKRKRSQSGSAMLNSKQGLIWATTCSK